MKKPAARLTGSGSAQRPAYSMAGSYARRQLRPLGRRSSRFAGSAHSILSPGLKSDILSRKTGSNEPQPPASSHIVQSCAPTENGHNTPVLRNHARLSYRKPGEIASIFLHFFKKIFGSFLHHHIWWLVGFSPRNADCLRSGAAAEQRRRRHFWPLRSFPLPCPAAFCSLPPAPEPSPHEPAQPVLRKTKTGQAYAHPVSVLYTYIYRLSAAAAQNATCRISATPHSKIASGT